MIGNKEFLELLNDVLKTQGYFVIGQHHGARVVLQVGDSVRRLMNFDAFRRFVIFEVAGPSDWRKQKDVIADLRPNWRRLPSQESGFFFKVRPAEKYRA